MFYMLTRSCIVKDNENKFLHQYGITMYVTAIHAHYICMSICDSRITRSIGIVGK